MFKSFCVVLVSGLAICFLGAFILLWMIGGLERFIDTSIFYSDFVLVLVIALPALFWGLWFGRPGTQIKGIVLRIALVFIAVFSNSFMTISNFRLTCLITLGLWCFGTLGLFLGGKMRSKVKP